MAHPLADVGEAQEFDEKRSVRQLVGGEEDDDASCLIENQTAVGGDWKDFLEGEEGDEEKVKKQELKEEDEAAEKQEAQRRNAEMKGFEEVFGKDEKMEENEVNPSLLPSVELQRDSPIEEYLSKLPSSTQTAEQLSSSEQSDRSATDPFEDVTTQNTDSKSNEPSQAPVDAVNSSNELDPLSLNSKESDQEPTPLETPSSKNDTNLVKSEYETLIPSQETSTDFAIQVGQPSPEKVDSPPKIEHYQPEYESLNSTLLPTSLHTTLYDNISKETTQDQVCDAQETVVAQQTVDAQQAVDTQQAVESTAKSSQEFFDPLLNPPSRDFKQTFANDLQNSLFEEETNPVGGGMYEHFLVVGLSANKKIEGTQTTVLEPSILYQYPPKKSLDVPKVWQFCFPEGVRTSVTRRTPSMSSLNEIFYGQSYLHSSENSHLFLLSGRDPILYGVCVTKVELLREQPSFISESSNNTPPRSPSNSTSSLPPVGTTSGGTPRSPTSAATTNAMGNRFITAPRCYCIISRKPLFLVHFEVLYSILAVERLTRIKKEYQRQINDTIEFDEMEGKREVEEILKGYFLAPAAIPGETFKFVIPSTSQLISFPCPSGDVEATTLGNWCLSVLLRNLSLEHFMILLSGVLLEKQIIFISKNIGIVTNSVMAMIPLLRPLIWQGLMVPILPTSMLDMVHAPVPFIVGVHSLPDRLLSQLDVMVVQLDTGKITTPSTYCLIPEEKKLQDNIRHEYNNLYRLNRSINTNPNPYNTPADQLQAVQIIQTAVRKYIIWFLDTITAHYRSLNINDVTKTEHVKTSFLTKISYQNRNFVKSFLDTQHFCVYIDKIVRQPQATVSPLDTITSTPAVQTRTE